MHSREWFRRPRQDDPLGDEGHKGHALRRGRVSIPNHAYFITKNVSAPDTAILSNPLCALTVIWTLRWLRSNELARLCGFVIMPDHYHAILGLGVKKDLHEIMASVNRHTSRRINEIRGRRGPFWEKGFYDRALRNRDEFDGALEYIHMNPVKKELVDRADQWRFSSANPEFADMIDWEWLGGAF